MPPSRPFYITTPIYYVNDRPHIGHCYTTVVADVAARFQRLIRGVGGPPLRGGERAAGTEPSRSDGLPGVFFLTGTDEHADKVVTSAASHGMSPQAWADHNAEEFRKAFAFIGSSHDDFIRTTEPRHKERVTRYVRALMDAGQIYKGDYTGWYDPGQEEYLTETAAREAGYKSAISGRPLVKRTEPCYFFRLSEYQVRLLEHIEGNPAFIQPDARRQEVLGRLRPPAVLNNVPVSRPVTDDPATQWGIRIPGDPAHRLYVWIDALFNYLTAVDTDERRALWPCTVHLIGKDILWFHAVIWPALLMALRACPGYEWVGLPGTVFGHGWWISEGQKMSKSLGNFIDLEKLRAYAGRYGAGALRWYLATQGPLAGNDADFSHAKFVEVYNADLANGIGNSTSRVGNMIEKYFEGRLPAHSPGQDANGRGLRMFPDGGGHRMMDHAGESADTLSATDRIRFDFANNAVALRGGVNLVQFVDQYINVTQPFKVAKQPESSSRDWLATILSDCVESLRVASLLFYPAMPEKMAELWRRWNCNHLRDPDDANSGFVAPLAELAEWGGAYSLRPGTPIRKGDPLFMRADPVEPPP
ncbi:MAG: class I tRNA ligase family protein [Phycisphaerales bacterium]|nr:class I tRNA ligase family protein [Phycisphaerales bacterium]